MSYTPLDLRNYTVPELRALAKEAPANIPAGGLSKLRKAELIDFIVAAYKAQEENERAVMAEPQGAYASDEEYAQAAEEDAGEDLVGQLLRQATEEARDERVVVAEINAKTRANAQALGQVAWANMRATVRSMDQAVQGRVVDTVLRTPNPDGSGRVLLVVEHQLAEDVRHGVRVGWVPVTSKTRTLHQLVDVKLEPVAS